MSYIPDYRGEENEKHLKKADKMYLLGYRAAIEDAKSFFDNTDVYECTESEDKVLQDARGCFDDWMEREETEQVLALFESGDYENLDLKDHNKSPYAKEGDSDD